MMGVDWRIPPSVLRNLERAPTDRPVVGLLRHSVRDHLPPGDAGRTLPITEVGRRLASELGARLGSRLRTLRASPLLRCMQTATALREGAAQPLAVVPDRLLGDPGVFVLDDRRAWTNWERLGHEGVMRHLVRDTPALSGMARSDEAARYLVKHMLAIADGRPGVHVFVTHDSLVTATAARLLRKPLGVADWPWYLEAALFWSDDDGVRVSYRELEGLRTGPLCRLSESDVLEFARREIAWTVGLDTEARFFLAGGAFKSLLTGRTPRDLDLWAPSPRDRDVLLDMLRAHGARPIAPRPFSDAFRLGERVIEVPHKTEPPTLRDRLAHFDIGLSAIGVERAEDGTWSVMVHPLAIESAVRREVLVLKPLVNRAHVLGTIDRMRRYALELGFSIPVEEEAEAWRVFEDSTPPERAKMVERYRQSGYRDMGVLEDIACRSR